MIDFSQFDSLIAMTMYFNNEATCRQTIMENDGVWVRTKTSFALIADNITAQHARTESSAATSASAISLAGLVQSLKTATSLLLNGSLPCTSFPHTRRVFPLVS